MAWDATRPNTTGPILTELTALRANWTALDDTFDMNNDSCNKVTLYDTTNAATGLVYVDDDSGATELFYDDAAGNTTQLTTAGVLKNSWALAETGSIVAGNVDFTAAAIATASEVLIVIDTANGGSNALAFAIGGIAQTVSAQRISVTSTTVTGLASLTTSVAIGFGIKNASIHLFNVGVMKKVSVIAETAAGITYSTSGIIRAATAIDEISYYAPDMTTGNFNLYVR